MHHMMTAKEWALKYRNDAMHLASGTAIEGFIAAVMRDAITACADYVEVGAVRARALDAQTPKAAALAAGEALATVARNLRDMTP